MSDTITENKNTVLYWLVVGLLAVLFSAWYHGWFEFAHVNADLKELSTLSQSECSLIHNAINDTVRDIGHYQTTAEATESLLMGVPQRPRDCRPIIKTALGKPALVDFEKALVNIKEHLPYRKENSNE